MSQPIKTSLQPWWYVRTNQCLICETGTIGSAIVFLRLEVSEDTIQVFTSFRCPDNNIFQRIIDHLPFFLQQNFFKHPSQCLGSPNSLFSFLNQMFLMCQSYLGNFPWSLVLLSAKCFHLESMAKSGCFLIIPSKYPQQQPFSDNSMFSLYDPWRIFQFIFSTGMKSEQMLRPPNKCFKRFLWNKWAEAGKYEQ